MRSTRIQTPAPALASALAALALLATAVAAQQTDLQFDQLAASELIVKFRSGTTLDAATKRAANDPRGDRELAAELERLTRGLGVVLRPKSVTSGGELVLELDREALGRTLAETLERQTAIAGAEPVPEPKRIRPASTLAVRIRPASGAGSGALESAVAAASRELGATLLLTPAEATESGAPEVTISIGHLMARIQTFLGERPEVEYSQLNKIAQPYGSF